MKVLKNFEAVFLGALVMTNVAAYATAEVPTVHVPAKVQAVAAPEAPMQVVVVKAKRMSVAEKAGQN